HEKQRGRPGQCRLGQGPRRPGEGGGDGMSAQYTPGPLEARRNRGPGNNGMTRIFTPNGDIVAEVNAKADAVLFAAAPELVEALRELVAEGCGCDTAEDYTEDGECRHTRARAALEKAGVAV